jgi:hypothetical protein
MFGEFIIAQLFCFNYFIAAQVAELEQVTPAFLDALETSD